MEIIFLISGFILGLIISWLIHRSFHRKAEWKHLNEINRTEREHNLERNRLSTENEILADRCKRLEEEKHKAEQAVEKQRMRSEELTVQLVRMKSDYQNIQEKHNLQRKEIEELHKKFTLEFENIAGKILKQNTQEFSQANQKNIGELLNPLKERLQHFEKKVDDTYQKGIKDQTDLKAEIKSLHALNRKISEEANNLTRALKGDVKKQGNWGEMILEKVLERSGLTKGVEYELQEAGLNEDGKSIRPDVIIHLPEGKHLVIDSKVSLVAYEQYINAEDDLEKKANLRQHLLSIRNHIKSLSEKRYESNRQLNSPDFVLMFLPVEPAFSAAIEHDVSLFNYAWERKIVMVSPTTLLATLKTVESIWRQEKQTRNALEIARQGGNLFDKFVSFLKDMDKIGNQLQGIQKTYEEANKKLSSGRGNLVRGVEKLSELGARTSKKIPDGYKQKALNHEEE